MPDPRLQWNEAVQQDLGLRVPSRPLRLSRDLREIPVDKYRLAKDGRKWKAIARERMALAEWLATHGNPDGSHIYPGVTRMLDHFGWSNGKLFYLLADLKELRLLESEGLLRERGPRIRRLNLRAFLGEAVESCGKNESQGAELQDSNQPNSKIRGAEFQRYVGDDRPSDRPKSNSKPTAADAAEFPPPVEKRKAKCPATPQRRRYKIGERLRAAAAEIHGKEPGIRRADLKEDLKVWAANNGIEYFDAWPGAGTLIDDAVDYVLERRKTA
jgi:hypothetical protein